MTERRELVRLPDQQNGGGEVVSGEVVDERAELAERLRSEALALEKEIFYLFRKHRELLAELAPRLWQFLDDRMWERLGDNYSSQNEWLASPDNPFSRSYCMSLVRVYGFFVRDRNMPVEELNKVDPVRLEVAIQYWKGDTLWQDAVSDAQMVSNRKEMKLLYERGRHTPMDATDEPDRMPCPMCGSFVEKDRIPEDEREAA